LILSYVDYHSRAFGGRDAAQNAGTAAEVDGDTSIGDPHVGGFTQGEDDGLGFDVRQVSSQALRLRRLGLVGIRERMDLIGGDVTVESVPGQGTRLQVCVPILQTKHEGS